MLAEKAKLRLARRGADRTHHGDVQVGYRGERPLGVGGFGHPWRQLESIADRCGKIRRAQAIEVGQRHRHARRPSTARPPSL